MMVKRVISYIVQTPYEDVLEVIKKSNCKYVSFDIFDTLIKRNVSCYTDIFSILEKEFNLTFNKKYNLVSMRLQAEKEARFATQYEDVTLKDIYKYISELSRIERDWLLRREEMLELTFCQRNFMMGEIFDWCIKNKQAVFIASDMYLSEEIIVKILTNAGYWGWKKIYLSSKELKRKSTGNLFKEMLDKEKLEGKEVIHIGDSIKGDYIMPKRCGMRACLIPKNVFGNKLYKCKGKKGELLDRKVLRNFINNNLRYSENFYEIVGYSILGPILFGYCKWLYDELNVKGINKVFFLAREGKLLKEAFDILYDEEKVESHLIAVSRQATVVPLLETAQSFEDVLNCIFVSRAKFSLENLYESCGLTETEIEIIENETNIMKSTFISKLKDDEKSKIFSSAKGYIVKKSQEQKKLITGYLDNQGFHGKIAVADVGWHGTIQNSLQKIFPQNEIYGFYIGRKNQKNAKAVKNVQGYLFDNDKNERILREVMFSVNLFEMLFLSTDGTTISYGYKRNKGFYPVRREPEQTEESAHIIDVLQMEALRFVNDFNESHIVEVVDISPEIYYESYGRFVNPPRMRIVNGFRKFVFLNVEENKLVAQHNLIYYLRHPIALKNDFLNNSCKLLFLKSLFILPLPYFALLCYVKKFDK